MATRLPLAPASVLLGRTVRNDDDIDKAARPVTRGVKRLVDFLKRERLVLEPREVDDTSADESDQLVNFAVGEPV